MVLSDPGSLAAWFGRARVLLIDDEPANLEFLGHVLASEGYGELTAISDSTEAVARFGELDPDVVITDLRMPGLDGFEVIARIQQQLPPDSYLPILVATADPAPETRRRALSAGARDFLTKPLSPAEVRLRVRNLLETRFLHEQLRDHNSLLETRVSERTRELEEARTEILFRLALAAEFRDDQTGQHTVRVGRLSARLAQVLGLSTEACDLIGRAAPLHDVGKIGIPDAILLKPGRLGPAEFAVMQRHAAIGANLLSGSLHPLLQLAEEIALSHHEHWDGRGYPHGLAGEAIPLSGRIVAVADVFDSLTHVRPYKVAWTVRDTLNEIQAKSGSQFDPAIVEALVRVVPETHLMEDGIRDDPGHAEQDAALNASRASMAMFAMAARVESLEAERDALAREVERLRRRVRGRSPRAARAKGTGQPDDATDRPSREDG
jgi:putative two-component system response regulator